MNSLPLEGGFLDSKPLFRIAHTSCLYNFLPNKHCAPPLRWPAATASWILPPLYTSDVDKSHTGSSRTLNTGLLLNGKGFRIILARTVRNIRLFLTRCHCVAHPSLGKKCRWRDVKIFERVDAHCHSSFMTTCCLFCSFAVSKFFMV